MFSITVSFKKNSFSGKYDIFPLIYTFPLILLRFPTSIYKNELQPEFCFPNIISLSPGWTDIRNCMVLISER